MTIFSGATMPIALLNTLKSWGLPERVISLTLRIPRGREPIEFDCSFYAGAGRDPIPMEDDSFVEITKTYRLVEAGPWPDDRILLRSGVVEQIDRRIRKVRDAEGYEEHQEVLQGLRISICGHRMP